MTVKTIFTGATAFKLLKDAVTNQQITEALRVKEMDDGLWYGPCGRDKELIPIGARVSQKTFLIFNLPGGNTREIQKRADLFSNRVDAD